MYLYMYTIIYCLKCNNAMGIENILENFQLFTFIFLNTRSALLYGDHRDAFHLWKVDNV